MIDIQLTYDGNEYDSIEDESVQKVLDLVKGHVQSRLSSFEQEIEQQEGLIRIDLERNSDDARIRFDNLPDELVDRLREALQ